MAALVQQVLQGTRNRGLAAAAEAWGGETGHRGARELREHWCAWQKQERKAKKESPMWPLPAGGWLGLGGGHVPALEWPFKEAAVGQPHPGWAGDGACAAHTAP